MTWHCSLVQCSNTNDRKKPQVPFFLEACNLWIPPPKLYLYFLQSTLHFTVRSQHILQHDCDFAVVFFSFCQLSLKVSHLTENETTQRHLILSGYSSACGSHYCQKMYGKQTSRHSRMLGGIIKVYFIFRWFLKLLLRKRKADPQILWWTLQLPNYGHVTAYTLTSTEVVPGWPLSWLLMGSGENNTSEMH